MHFRIVSDKDRSLLPFLACVCVCTLFFHLCLSSFYEWTGNALHIHVQATASLTMSLHMDFIHFSAKIQSKMNVDAYCTGHTDIQRQTVIHWPTERQKTKELQTNLITDAISPHCLSLFLLHRHKSRHILKHWDTAITAMIWCTEMYISHPQRMQDNIGLKRQISLQIKIPSSMSSHIQRKKNHKEDSHKTPTHPGKHRQNKCMPYY